MCIRDSSLKDYAGAAREAMGGLCTPRRAEFSGIRGALRAQINRARGLASSVNARPQAPEDGLARLAAQSAGPQ
eukprot:12977358-Alexandrium_andersonii.AAC.1